MFSELGIRADDQILPLQRVRSADGRPLMLENNYFSNARYGFLAGEPLAGSLYQLLEARCAVTPGSAPGTIVEMVRAARDMAALLETKSGEPLFQIRALIRDQRGEPLHVAEHFVLADRYSFTF